MRVKFPSPYELKKAVMYPRKLYMRRKENLEPGFLQSALELHYYRPAFYKWMGAVAKNPQLLHEANLNSQSIVLDVGAYIGEWAQEIIDLYHPRILAFEPDPRNFKKLQKFASTQAALDAFSYGLSDKDESLQMAMQHLGSTVFNDNLNVGDATWAQVELKDIAQIWNTLELDQVDLMKVNIEGGEYPLFERMIESNLLGKVDCYLIQFHEWHPGAYSRRRRIQKALSATHRLEWDYHFVWEKWVRK